MRASHVEENPPFDRLLATCAIIPGCLVNSVHSITTAPRTGADAAHAIVVIGVKDSVVIMDEYSVKTQDISGNCYHYNRIEATNPSSPGKVTYFAYEVPAGTYVYSRRNAASSLDPPALGLGFIAPAAKTVYFGDYISVGHNTVQFRRDIEAARLGSQGLLRPARCSKLLNRRQPLFHIHFSVRRDQTARPRRTSERRRSAAMGGTHHPRPVDREVIG